MWPKFFAKKMLVNYYKNSAKDWNGLRNKDLHKFKFAKNLRFKVNVQSLSLANFFAPITLITHRTSDLATPPAIFSKNGVDLNSQKIIRSVGSRTLRTNSAILSHFTRPQINKCSDFWLSKNFCSCIQN